MRRTIAALFLFGISFGYVEAAVVVYLRAHLQSDPRHVTSRPRPERSVPADHAAATGRTPDPRTPRRLVIEIGREAATMVMLGSVRPGRGAATSTHWFAAFAVAFGVWDISFYAFLRI